MEEFVGDTDSMSLTPRQLLNSDYLSRRAKTIDMKKAKEATAGVPTEGGTVYITAADQNGMMVSFMQSNWLGFGSGIVVPGTGISLHNRGSGFNLTKGHPNIVAGGKRPFHTIIPGFMTHKNKPFSSFGVMGGAFQAQGHVQMAIRIGLYKQNPQAASDAPRWRFRAGNEIIIEVGTPHQVLNGLKKLGHKVTVAPASYFGGAQIICKLENGSYVAASDHRKDGFAGGI